MKALGDFPRLHLCTTPLDFRRGLEYLASVATEACGNRVMLGELFAFTNRARDRIRLIYWDDTGFAMWMKRLDKDRFTWPRRDERVVALSVDEMRWLLAGLDIDKMRGHQKLAYASHS